MLVDWRAAGHLVGSDYPFIAAREHVIGEFPPMHPPRIPIHPQAEKATFDVVAEFEVGFGKFHLLD